MASPHEESAYLPVYFTGRLRPNRLQVRFQLAQTLSSETLRDCPIRHVMRCELLESPLERPSLKSLSKGPIC